MDETEDDVVAVVREVLERRAARRSEPALTIRALYARYGEARAADKSWPAYVLRLCAFVAAHADRAADRLAVIDWTTYATGRRRTLLPGKRGTLGECYSETTVNAELGAVKAMLNWATTQGLLRYNPLAAARRKTRKRRETAPMEYEVGRALDACQTRQQVVMVLAAADVGMRRGEIRHLRHDWIDHERKTVTLPDWACKNGRGGAVPCTQRFLDAVAAIPRHIRHPHVLVSERGDGAYGRTALDDWWVGIRERAGLEAAPGERAMRLHDCRAGAASNALKRGVQLKTISKRILRHSSLAVTEQYLRGMLDDPEDLTRASDAMEAGIIRDQARSQTKSTTELK